VALTSSVNSFRIALVVPDGPGVRNFVLGPFLPTACAAADICVLHPVPENLLDCYRAAARPPVRWEPLLPFRDSLLSFMLRNTLGYAQMYWADTGAMRYNRRARIGGSWRTKTATRVARAAGCAAASPRAMSALDRWHDATIARAPETVHYRRLFEDMRPSVLFCSNQRAPVAAPAVAAAKQLGIPTATFIFSWDNVTSKGRIVAPFDHYLVWSVHMRRELLAFYPHIDPRRIHVVGTPQFDPYADTTVTWSREEFMRRIGADAGRPLICYSGGDPTLYTAEFEYVRLLMNLVRRRLVNGSPQVILRPSPADDGRQYDAVRREFPELLYAPPAWAHTRPGEWSRILPLPADVPMLANLTRHADVNINLNSTMTLDFAIHDRPVVNIAFDVISPPPFGAPLWDFFYQFDHYHPVIEFGAARFPRSPEQLADALNAYLADPALDRAGRRAFVDLEVGVPIGQSSTRLVEVLAAVANAPITTADRHPAVAAIA
jgi:hypothetical protein